MLASDIIDAPLADGLLLGRRLGQQIFALNHSGRLLWEALRRGCPEDELPDVLVEAYGIDAAQAKADVAKALESWREAGLLPAAQAESSLSGLLGGTPVHLRFTDDETAQRFRAVLTGAFDAAAGADAKHCFEATVSQEGGRFVVAETGKESVTAKSFDDALEQIENALRTAVFQATPWDLAVHAAAVGLGEQAALLYGQSGRGKSTLAAALLLRGHRHLADDLVMLSGEAEVRPLPLPLVLKAGTWPILPELARQLLHIPAYLRSGQKVRYWLPPAEQIGSRPLPVRLIVQPHYRAGAALSATPMDSQETLAALIEAPMRVGRPLQPEGLGRLARWLESCPAVRLVYGDAEAAAGWIEERLAP